MAEHRLIDLELPFPPSVNTYWRHVGSKVLVSAQGRKYRSDVEVIAFAKFMRRVECHGELELLVDLYPPDNRRRDIDNPVKALLDSLQAARIFENDNQVKRLVVEMRDVVKGGKAVVRINQRP